MQNTHEIGLVEMFRKYLLYLVTILNVISAQEKYKQQRTLLPNGGLTLSWGVEFDRLYFKLVSKNAKSVAFVLSYNDIPTDGIFAGYYKEDSDFIHDLHLDFAGIGQKLGHMIKISDHFLF